MAILKSVIVMRGPGSNANLPYPASYVATIVSEELRYQGISTDIPGVNSKVTVQILNGRTLNRTQVYYVNQTTTQLDALIIAG